MLNLLLLDTYDNDSGYLAHLLFDLLKSDSQSQNVRTSALIYESLHWNLKKIFKESDDIVEAINDKISNFNEDAIPYEKRIHLMKASDYVKNKAMDKLKEINNSKNGESNAKAQQYLDGLLKIPFGMYKKEIIRVKLDELRQKYEKSISCIIRDINDCEEKYTLSDTNLMHTANLTTVLKDFEDVINNPINIGKLNKSLKKWTQDVVSTTYKLSDIFDIDCLTTELKKQKVNDLKEICLKCGINVSGKKNILIENILGHKYSNNEITNLKKYDIVFKKIYTQLSETEQFINIIANIEQINNSWNKYVDSQSKYFKDVSKTLDNAVYGLDDAKNQIKRLLAQWVNGNDQGYVFGFEGPPGTGKTTLAKQGIANCLRDELNNKRPFVFIAL